MEGAEREAPIQRRQGGELREHKSGTTGALTWDAEHGRLPAEIENGSR